jgi:hypothetical protein
MTFVTSGLMVHSAAKQVSITGLDARFGWPTTGKSCGESNVKGDLGNSRLQLVASRMLLEL